MSNSIAKLSLSSVAARAPMSCSIMRLPVAIASHSAIGKSQRQNRLSYYVCCRYQFNLPPPSHTPLLLANMTRHNIILLRDTDGSRPMSARAWQRIMVLIREWRIRQINLENYPDIYDFPYDDINASSTSESESEFNEVTGDEQEPEPERDQNDSHRAEDYQ
jgi:hypothetical protein